MNERTFHARDAHKLEDPERLKYLPPEEVMARLAIVPGMTIADIGTGTGYFALPFAGSVGSNGKILAVDFQKEMLEKLGRKLSGPGAPRNIILVEGEAANSTLGDNCCDLVFMANLWHELDDEAGVLREVKRLIRPKGRLAILDWRADPVPPPGPPAAHRIAAEDVGHVLLRHGWSVESAGHVGAYHYLVVAGLAERSL
jgi:ubiquinone/menaquinone biosynthesis C-methylase UbiE